MHSQSDGPLYWEQFALVSGFVECPCLAHTYLIGPKPSDNLTPVPRGFDVCKLSYLDQLHLVSGVQDRVLRRQFSLPSAVPMLQR